MVLVEKKFSFCVKIKIYDGNSYWAMPRCQVFTFLREEAGASRDPALWPTSDFDPQVI